MATFVLVPGACHGGWWFEPFARRLRRRGHEAYPLTLTGVGAGWTFEQLGHLSLFDEGQAHFPSSWGELQIRIATEVVQSTQVLRQPRHGGFGEVREVRTHGYSDGLPVALLAHLTP